MQNLGGHLQATAMAQVQRYVMGQQLKCWPDTERLKVDELAMFRVENSMANGPVLPLRH